jgi:hypothetical protein
MARVISHAPFAWLSGVAHLDVTERTTAEAAGSNRNLSMLLMLSSLCRTPSTLVRLASNFAGNAAATESGVFATVVVVVLASVVVVWGIDAVVVVAGAALVELPPDATAPITPPTAPPMTRAPTSAPTPTIGAIDYRFDAVELSSVEFASGGGGGGSGRLSSAPDSPSPPVPVSAI